MEAKRLRNWPSFAVFHFIAMKQDNYGQLWTIMDKTGHCKSGASPACLVPVVPDVADVPIPSKAVTVIGANEQLAMCN